MRAYADGFGIDPLFFSLMDEVSLLRSPNNDEYSTEKRELTNRVLCRGRQKQTSQN
jgi:hypothetical protein